MGKGKGERKEQKRTKGGKERKREGKWEITGREKKGREEKS